LHGYALVSKKLKKQILFSSINPSMEEKLKLNGGDKDSLRITTTNKGLK